MNIEYSHLKSYSTFSLRKSVVKPDDLVKKTKEDGFTSLAITELGNIYSAVKIVKACKKEKIKPILGCNLYISDSNYNLANLTLLCKNHNGWRDLLKIIAKSNQPEYYNENKQIATLPFEQLKELVSQNFIVYTGSLFSWLPVQFCKDYNKFVAATEYQEAKDQVKDDWQKIIGDQISLLQEVFGKSNVFLESQKSDINEIPGAEITVKIIEWAAKKYKVPCIATCRPHYLRPEQSEDQKILICVDKKTTLMNIEHLIKDDVEYLPFFRNEKAYLFNQEEYKSLYNQEQLETNMSVANMIELFEIGGKPKLPNFDCPNNENPDEFLKGLCYKALQSNYNNKPEYKSRLEEELNTLLPIGLSSYLLIVWDIVNYCHSKDWLVSSRGSVGGSLIANLLGISECDPIKYNLIFSRFYNAGRNSKDNISLPDVDLDLMSQHRETVFDYVRGKYGLDKTANIVTFSGLEGASALKEVLRVKNRCSVDEQNIMSKLIIKKDKISDELEELRNAGMDPSIIGWSLDNVKKLEEFAYYDDNGELAGEYGKDFAQAIRIEGCKRQTGVHACGLVISSLPLVDYCPIVHSKKYGAICGFEKPDIEYVGGPKMDLLVVATLSDIHETIKLINEGDFVNE